MRHKPLAVSAVNAVLAVVVATTAAAAVKLPKVIDSHMVLQREMAVPIWGTADAGTIWRGSTRCPGIRVPTFLQLSPSHTFKWGSYFVCVATRRLTGIHE